MQLLVYMLAMVQNTIWPKLEWDVPPETENRVGCPTTNKKQGGTSHHKQKTGWDIPPETETRVGHPTANRKQGGMSHQKQKTVKWKEAYAEVWVESNGQSNKAV